MYRTLQPRRSTLLHHPVGSCAFSTVHHVQVRILGHKPGGKVEVCLADDTTRLPLPQYVPLAALSLWTPPAHRMLTAKPSSTGDVVLFQQV